MKKPILITALAVLAVAHADRLAAQAPGPNPLHCVEVREHSLAGILAEQAEAADEVRAAAQRAGLDSVRGLVYVAPGLGARILGGNLPQPLADSLSSSLLERLAAHRKPTNPHAALLLRLDPLPLPACGPRRRRESLPQVINDREMTRVLRDVATAGRPAFPRRGPAMLRMVITRDGEVASAQLMSPDATVQFEEGVLEIARRLRYRPAALDGVPVDVVLLAPVNL